MTKKWWHAAGIRALKTLCQTAVAMIGTAVVLSELDWKYVISGAVLAGIVSILTSVATGLPEAKIEDKEDE